MINKPSIKPEQNLARDLKQHLKVKSERRLQLLQKVVRRKSVIRDLNVDFNKWQSKFGGKIGVEKDNKEESLQEEPIEVKPFCVLISDHIVFKTLIMVTILFNVITMAFESYPSMKNSHKHFFQAVDVVYLAIYTVEALIKLKANYKAYFSNGYDRFDFIILLISFVAWLQESLGGGQFSGVSFLRVFRGLRALRALRSVSMIRQLQVIVSALLKTMRSIVNLLVLLFILMYLFANIYVYFFGKVENGADEWGSLDKSIYNLWVYVTVDGWVELQSSLDEVSQWSRVFTVAFMFSGHFIFTNLFIGVIIQNLDEAQEELKTRSQVKKAALFLRKKDLILNRQQAELQEFELKKGFRQMRTDSFMEKMVGRLRHDEITPVTDLPCKTAWMETYLVSLQYRSQTIQSLQALHSQCCTVIADLLESRLQKQTTADRWAREVVSAHAAVSSQVQEKPPPLNNPDVYYELPALERNRSIPIIEQSSTFRSPREEQDIPSSLYHSESEEIIGSHASLSTLEQQQHVLEQGQRELDWLQNEFEEAAIKRRQKRLQKQREEDEKYDREQFNPEEIYNDDDSTSCSEDDDDETAAFLKAHNATGKPSSYLYRPQ